MCVVHSEANAPPRAKCSEEHQYMQAAPSRCHAALMRHACAASGSATAAATSCKQRNHAKGARMAKGSGDNIYGDVNSGTDIRDINRQIRSEMRDVSQRGDLTELKKRA